mgnify:FL=1
MEGKTKQPEWIYTTPPGTVDREAEEKAIADTDEAMAKAAKVAAAQPPSLDVLGPRPGIEPEDLGKVNPRGPSTHAAHVARGLEEAEDRQDRGPRG